MTNWQKLLDGTSVLYVGEVHASGVSFDHPLSVLLGKLDGDIAGKGNAEQFDTLFLEVNVDTGRILAALSTVRGRDAGILDGCAVRYAPLQDVWYDLDDAALPDDEFDGEIRSVVLEIGKQCAQALNSGRWIHVLAPPSLSLVVFGSEPGDVVWQTTIGR
jgi:hypothetical protein